MPLDLDLLERIRNNAIRRIEAQRLSVPDMAMLCEALKTNLSVDQISFTSCPVKPELIAHLAVRENLGSLTLRSCGVNDADAKLLAQNPNIAVLALPYNIIGDDAARVIAEESQATKIDLSYNAISGETLRIFGESTVGILNIEGHVINGSIYAALLRNKKLAMLTHSEIGAELALMEKEDVLFAAEHSNVACIISNPLPQQWGPLDLRNPIAQAASAEDQRRLDDRLVENQKRVRSLGNACWGQRLDEIENLLSDPAMPVLPYGEEINRYFPGRVGLLGIAVALDNKRMLDLFLKYMPRSEFYLKDVQGLTYEDYAKKNSFTLLVDQKPAYLMGLRKRQSLTPTSDSALQVRQSILLTSYMIVFLNLSYQSLAYNDATIIAGIETVRFLCLSYCSIDDESADVILQKTKASVVDMAHNNIGANGVSFMPNNPHVFSLNVAYNHIGDPGAMLLSRDKKAVAFNLAGNGISDKSGALFGNETRASYVDMSDNMITGLSVVGFAINHFITTLYLNKNLIGNKDTEKLVKNTRLSTLGLAHNRVGNKGATAIMRNRLLTDVILKDKDVSDSSTEYQIKEPKTKKVDDRTYYAWAKLNMSQSLNLMTPIQHARTQKHIEDNQKQARELVDILIKITSNPITRESVLLYERIKSRLRFSSERVVLPYGSYINRYLREKGYGGNLLHLAVRGRMNNLLRLLLQYMPRHAYYERDTHGLTYEDLAEKLNFTLAEDLKSSALMNLFHMKEEEEQNYYNMLLLALKKAYKRAEMLSIGMRARPNMEETALLAGMALAAEGMALVTSAHIPIVSSLADFAERSIEFASDAISEKRAHAIMAWLKDENDVELLANQLRLFYQDISTLHDVGGVSGWSEISEQTEKNITAYNQAGFTHVWSIWLSRMQVNYVNT